MNIRAFSGLRISVARVMGACIVLVLLLAAMPALPASASLPMSVASIVVGSQVGTLTYGTPGSATYTVTLTAGGGQNGDLPAVTLSIPALPAGVSYGFSPNPTTPCTGNGCVATSTLTLSTLAATPALTAQSFTVAGSGTSFTGVGTLTVGRRPITVTAVTDTKTYDGTTASSALPMITSGELATGDMASWSQSFNTKHAGSGKTLTPTGTVSDGNGGNNYQVTFAPIATGTINKLSITVTAAANTKTYDATTTAAALPTHTGVMTGDSAAFTEAYTDRHAGANKTLVPTGVVNDGNAGNNYTYIMNSAAVGTIDKKPITVTAAANTKVYDRGLTAAAVPSYSGVLPGDTANFIEAYLDKTVGSNKTLTPSGSITDGNGGNNYAVEFVSANTGVITAVTVTLSGLSVPARAYDGTTAASLAGTPVLAGVLSGDTVNTGGSPTAAFLDKNAGTGKTVNVTGYALVGGDAGNYTLIQPVVLAGTISQKPITVTALTNTKVYDGTTTAAAIPTHSGVAAGDTPVFTEAYADKHAGEGNKSLAPSGLVTDGNSGLNYAYTYTNVGNGTISQKPITVTAAMNTKVYDGTLIAAAIPTNTGVAAGDTAAFIEAYADKHAGTGNKILTPSGGVTDGNGGLNYSYTYVNLTTGTISQKPITVTALMNTKVYDGTTTAAAIPSSTALTPVDTGVFTEAYETKAAGAANKLLIPSAVITDGNGGANYAVTLVNFTSGTITPKPLTITGLTGTDRIYDGTAVASFTGMATLSGAIPLDDVTLGGTPVGTFANKNVGPGKAITVTGYTLAGLDAANYSLPSQPTGLVASITAKPITVTAVTNTKVYDGALTAAAIPTHSGVATGDTAAFIEAYSTKHAGTGNKVLMPSGLVTDGNTGLNYSYTYVSFPTGTISQKPITVTAVANTKVYDGTLTAAAIPTNTGVVTGDTAAFIEAYADKHVGTGNKTLTPSGVVTDGNSGLNYIYTYTPIATGTINKRAITVRAVTNTKTYNGSTASTGIPTISVGSLATGDTATWIQTFDNKNVGTNKVLTPSGTVNDGNAGSNYTVTFTTVSTGTINAAALTIKARDASKLYGEVLTFYGTEFTTVPSSLYAVDFVSNVVLTSEGAAAGAAVGTYPITPSSASGNGLSNYAIAYVDGLLTVNAAAPAFSASPASWDFGLVKVSTTSAARLFTVTNAGGSDLIFGTVTLAGANAGQFLITADTCSGAAVAAGNTCAVTAAFKPTSAGARSAALSFPDNTASSPHTVPLNGRGGAELAVNGGFNTYPSATARVPSNWTATAFSSTDGKNTAFKKEGAASVRIANTSAVTKTLAQTRTVSGAAGSALQLSVWVKGQAVPATGGPVQAQVQLYNGTTLLQTRTLSLPSGTYGFTQKKLAFTATKAYNKVVIKLVYGRGGGAIWFDGLSLIR